MGLVLSLTVVAYFRDRLMLFAKLFIQGAGGAVINTLATKITTAIVQNQGWQPFERVIRFIGGSQYFLRAVVNALVAAGA